MRLLNSGHADFGKGGGDPDEGKTDLRLREAHDNDEIDSKYGFDRVRSRYLNQALWVHFEDIHRYRK